jgi:hypothetical protein
MEALGTTFGWRGPSADGEIDYLLEQLSQGLEGNNALMLIDELLEKLDAKTMTQADQCAEMRASRIAQSDAMQESSKNQPSVGLRFLPALRCLHKTYQQGQTTLHIEDEIATLEDIDITQQCTSCQTDDKDDEEVGRKAVTTDCSWVKGRRKAATTDCRPEERPSSRRKLHQESFRAFLEESDSEPEHSRTSVSRVSERYKEWGFAPDHRPVIASSSSSEASRYSDAMSSKSISDLASEISEIPEEILEVISVVSADFSSLSPSHPVGVSTTTASTTPSEVSEDIVVEEEFSDTETVWPLEDESCAVPEKINSPRQPSGRSEHSYPRSCNSCLSSPRHPSECSDEGELPCDTAELIQAAGNDIDAVTSLGLDTAKLALCSFTCLENRCASLEQLYQQSRVDLLQTRSQLADTQDELLRTRLGLSETRMELTRTQAQLTQVQVELACMRSKVSPGCSPVPQSDSCDPVEDSSSRTVPKFADQDQVSQKEVHEAAKGCILSEPNELSKALKPINATAHDQADVNDDDDATQERQEPELILKVSHQGSIFRVRPPSSDVESVQMAAAGILGAEYTSCLVSIINGSEPHPLSKEAWLQVLSEVTQSRASPQEPIIIRLHAEHQPEPERAEETENDPTELHYLVDNDNETEGAHAGGPGSVPVQERQDDANVPVVGTHVIQRLASRLSSSVWGAMSILRAGSVHV